MSEQDDPMIPDGRGNMINQRWQQIIEEKENEFFQLHNRDPEDADYESIEDAAGQLFDAGYQPAKPSRLQEEELARLRQEVEAKKNLYETMKSEHGGLATAHRIRIDDEIDDDVQHIASTESKKTRPYHVETKSKTENGKRTWSIKQIYD